jgi:hypothetical protein
LPGCLLLARVANQRPQRLQVGAGSLLRELRHRAFLGEQPLAPGFGAPVPRGVRGALSLPLVELRADRRRIHLAHQSPDVLQLAAPRFARGDAPCLEHGFAQVFGEVDLREAVGGDLHEARAERLKLVHVALLLRFARCGGRVELLRIGAKSGHDGLL